MRVKNDTVIKWSKLADTMFLTNEQFGALIRMVMIADDEDQVRYQYLNEDSIRDLMECEKEWRKQFEVLKTANPIMRMCYASVYGQVCHSHEAFNRKQAEYEEKDEKRKQTTEDKPKKKKDENQDEIKTLNYPIMLQDGIEHIFTITFPNRNKDNVPSLYDIAGIEDGDSTIEEVLNRIETLLKKGNSDNWNNYWMAYYELPDIE